MNTQLPEPNSDERAHSDQLAALLRNEIRANGSMPFSRWMELCLYAPGLGYYSAGRTKFGAAGDFVTAPELGSLYARCLARAFAPTLGALGADADVLELGGGSGAFAVDALRELAAMEALPRRFLILEPSADLAARQRARIAAELPADVAARAQWIARPPERGWHGVLFANEVVDALPTTRFTLLEGEVHEEHVALDGGGRFVRVDRPADLLVANAVRHLERALGTPFVDGYRSEVLPQLPYWMQAVAATLEAGVALFVDYGYPRAEYYLPTRSDGTLVCHYRHRAHADPLHWPGLTDITAFVDFTALAEAGVGAGFDFVGYAPQGQFLLASGLLDLVDDGLPEIERVQRVAEAKRLTLPGDMGERFQAIAFARGGVDALPGLRAFDLSHRL
ncbi:class I SAM-dependent methyltransferase [Dokdonella sp.]|uniref:class I SAM-dependent methyltransferase n=1 Tax=Dokdonella sp. TaxID=2291710 RepID=UPI002F3F92C6